MYCKYFLISIVLLFSASPVKASDVISWNKGVIHLATKEKVWGDISYDSRLDIIQCKSEGIIRAFSAHNVVSFRFFDKELDVNRYFRTVEEKRGFYKKKSFYEVVMDGNLTMLRKKKDFTTFRSEEDYSIHEKDYHYFILGGERLIKISRFKKEIVKGMMGDMAIEIKSYIKEARLYPHKLRDQILIVDFYNELKGTDSQRLSGLAGQQWLTDDSPDTDLVFFHKSSCNSIFCHSPLRSAILFLNPRVKSALNSLSNPRMTSSGL